MCECRYLFYVLDRVVITIFFGNAVTTPPIFKSFWDDDSEFDIGNFEFEKMTAQAIWNFKITVETKKSKFANFNKMGSYRLQMSRVFQIWSQNLNRTAFDPLFGQNSVENWQNPVFDHYFKPRRSKLNGPRCDGYIDDYCKCYSDSTQNAACSFTLEAQCWNCSTWLRLYWPIRCINVLVP